MILQLKRWLSNRQIIVVADSFCASFRRLDAVRHHVCMITPRRLDARLFDAPHPQPAGKRGPKPKIGSRPGGAPQPTLKERIENDTVYWQTIIIPQWYGQSNKVMQIATGTAFWYKIGLPKQ